ncbi:MAG TPA: RNA polymerase sigma factor [Verrucomicrobiae bacterium]|jgi:RNA polymerase sigma-70 factor (ECF subfamily)|nr:RNA polymerase sigma factor [Verrucomicrobiae bacterium]
MSDPAEILCERAQKGDLAAASELVSLFYQRIFAYLRRLSRNDEDAADLTQKTFTRTWQSLASYQHRSRFSTWLHGIAYHVYLDWRRKRSSGEAQTDEWWETQPANSPTPYENTAERELARQLYRWVDELDDEKKQTVHLHYYQNLPLSETAEVLGVAVSTVKYRLREALVFLRTRSAQAEISPERKVV